MIGGNFCCKNAENFLKQNTKNFAQNFLSIIEKLLKKRNDFTVMTSMTVFTLVKIHLTHTDLANIEVIRILSLS